jgi:hypothetical protein
MFPRYASRVSRALVSYLQQFMKEGAGWGYLEGKTTKPSIFSSEAQAPISQ